MKKELRSKLKKSGCVLLVIALIIGAIPMNTSGATNIVHASDDENKNEIKQENESESSESESSEPESSESESSEPESSESESSEPESSEPESSESESSESESSEPESSESESSEPESETQTEEYVSNQLEQVSYTENEQKIVCDENGNYFIRVNGIITTSNLAEKPSCDDKDIKLNYIIKTTESEVLDSKEDISIRDIEHEFEYNFEKAGTYILELKLVSKYSDENEQEFVEEHEITEISLVVEKQTIQCKEETSIVEIVYGECIDIKDDLSSLIQIEGQLYPGELKCASDTLNDSEIFEITDGKIKVKDILEDKSEEVIELYYEETPISEKKDNIKITLAAKPKEVELLLLDNNLEELSYRKCIDTPIRKSIKFVKKDSQEEIVNPEELSKINYDVSFSNTNIIGLSEKTDASSDNYGISMQVKSVGESTLTISNKGTSVYQVNEKSINIKVKNSAINESDLEFEYKIGDNIKNYSFEEWNDFLESSGYWLNNPVTILLVGNAYDYLHCDKEINTDRKTIVLGSSQSDSMTQETYTFWMSKNSAGANTSLAEKDGKKNISFKLDRVSPIKVNMTTNQNKVYDKVDEGNIYRWYFSENFKISGTYRDELSGIKKLQYSIDDTQSWIDVDVIDKKIIADESGGREIENWSFEIELGNGEYTNIAVRALDIAGNISEVYKVADSDKPVHIVVNTNKPDCVINVYSETELLTDEVLEKWTNKELTYWCVDIKRDIKQVKYQYVPIKKVIEATNKGISPYNKNGWKTMSDKKELIVGGSEKPEDRNGVYYFKTISKSGIESDVVAKTIKLQQTLPEKMELIVENDRCDLWYNAETGSPEIKFQFEDYFEKCVTEADEYSAPITIHREILTSEVQDDIDIGSFMLKTATIGFSTIGEYKNYLANKTQYTIDAYKNEVEQLNITFKKGEEIYNGKFIVKYWIEDAAGNKSDVSVHHYNIDTIKPEVISVNLSDGTTLQKVENGNIVYDIFRQNTVTGTVNTSDSLSGVKSTKILKAKKISECNFEAAKEEGSNFSIEPCKRCFLYVVVEDEAGNKNTITTNGIVVDNKEPVGQANTKLIVEPKGANKNGFFNEDFIMEVSIKDAPDDDNYSSLQEVKYAIGNNGNTGGDEKVLFNSALTGMTEADLKTNRNYNTSIEVDAKRYEGNEAFLEVTAKDKSNNVCISRQELKIDVTDPIIEINFDNNTVRNGKYFNSDRTATIHVSELNFAPNEVKVQATKDGTEYPVNISSWTSDGKEHYATVTFNEDGDYTLKVNCIDMADNEADEAVAEPFTIDKTTPEVKVLYDNEVPYKENYYSKNVIASIIVTEHNFDENEFKIVSDSLVTIGKWFHNGDEHKVSVSFNEDGHYSFECDYIDLAGNAIVSMAKQEFYIDTIAPTVTISGVENNSANSGAINPVVTILDENYDAEGINIHVETGRGKSVNLAHQINAVENGFSYILTDLTNNDDDIYYLTASGTDLAGNNTEVVYRFSLNRNGSTYDLSNISKMSEKTYYKSSDVMDMAIVEMNVDRVEKFSIHMTRNGSLLSNRQVNGKTDIDKDEVCYQVEVNGDEKTGYTYEYTIFKENFEQEGMYNISFYSKDMAGNEVNSTLDDKKAEVHFIVDNTVPKAVFDGVATGEVYAVDSKTVNVMVTDNFKLAEAEFYLVNETGEELKYWNYFDMVDEEGTVVQLEIPEYDGKQSIMFRAIDVAGNEIITKPDSKEVPISFIVSTNPITRIMNVPVKIKENQQSIIFNVLMAIAGFAIAGGTMAIVYRKKRLVKN